VRVPERSRTKRAGAGHDGRHAGTVQDGNDPTKHSESRSKRGSTFLRRVLGHLDGTRRRR